MDVTTVRLVVWSLALVIVAALFVLAGARHMANLTTVLQSALGALTGLGPKLVLGGGGSPAVLARSDVRSWLGTAVLRPTSQRNQTLPAGAETATWWNDCGETCCTMLVEGCRGVWVAPDELRVQYLPGNLV